MSIIICNVDIMILHKIMRFNHFENFTKHFIGRYVNFTQSLVMRNNYKILLDCNAAIL